MSITVKDIISQRVLDLSLYPSAVATVAFSIYSAWYGPWDAFSLLCLCGISVSSARLLQSEGLQRWRQRQGAQPAVCRPARDRALRALLGLLGLLVVQILVSADTPALLASRWYLVLFTPLLAAAFELIGTPRVELSEALADSQINYAQGAAWSFFIGYLVIPFGQAADAGENTDSFYARMGDYLASENVSDGGETLTCRSRMIILVPTRHEALLSDGNFSHNDGSVKKEKKLPGIQQGGRVYGETQVYTITDGERRYRVAMEEATPIRTAALAVEDAAVEDFDKEDFDEFARRFLRELQEILAGKPGIRDQVELVPIEDMRRIGETVAKRVRELERAEAGGGQRAAAGPPAR